MLAYVTIVERGSGALSSRELGGLRAEFPGVVFDVGEAGRADMRPGIAIELDGPRLDGFRAADFDAHQEDCACEALAGQGAFGLRIAGHGVDVTAAFAALTRYQRFLDRRNPDSAGPAFDRVLACHRALHDCRKPLVRADLAHALDTWQWLLRLDPGASLAVQVAALFHDIERLASEADTRVEQHARDYRAFKYEHARRGAAMTRAALAATDLDQAVIDRASELVAEHERPGDQAERLLLNEADALSFFSLNSAGFLRYYGVEHTRQKVAYTLARLRVSARLRLGQIQYHPVVADMLHEAGITTYRRHMTHGERDRITST